MNKAIRTLVYKMYVYKLFDDLVFIYPFYTILMRDRGLNPLQISIALMVWSITAFVLEVPSGVVADKYSRKHILAFAQLARIVGYAVWLLIPNFAGFVLGFILWGIKSAFTSGTYDALVYDELAAFGEEKSYTKYIGRINGLSFIGMLLASAGASIAIHWGYGFVIIISLFSLFISWFAVLTVPQTTKTESTHEKEYFKLLKQGLVYSFKTPLLLGLIVFISLVQGLSGGLDEYWSLFASYSGLNQYFIPIFIAAFSAVQFTASNIAHYFAGFSNKTLYGLFVFQGAVLLIASLTMKQWSVLFLLVFSFIFKIIDTILKGRLQANLPPHIRATVSSVNGLFVELASTGVFITYGFVANRYTNQTAFVLFATAIMCIGATYIFLRREPTRSA